MDSQRDCILPIPILQAIVDFSDIREEVAFSSTCKLLRDHFYRKYPTITNTLKLQMNLSFRSSFAVLDSTSNIMYTSEGYCAILRIDLVSNTMTTFCGSRKGQGFKDGIGEHSYFSHPTGLALNEKESVLYIADSRNHCIRTCNLIDGMVETICGNGNGGSDDGIGIEATFRNPMGLVFDSVSNYLYVADWGNHSIRRILLNERRVETLCGGGEGYVNGSFEEAKFDYPFDIVMNPYTEELYLNDYANQAVRVISLKTR